MECFSYCNSSPSPTCLLPSRSSLIIRRSLGYAPELCRERPCPGVIRGSVLYMPIPATPVRMKANAVNDFCAISAVSPAKSGDISVFLQTSAVLLGAYWVANFWVPDLISKNLGFVKGKKDDESDEE